MEIWNETRDSEITRPFGSAHCRLSGWVAPFAARQAKVNAVRELLSQSQEELGALLPSVLDRAFKGEL